MGRYSDDRRGNEREKQALYIGKYVQMGRWPTCGWISQDQWEWNRMETSGKKTMAELWVRETDRKNGNRENSV